METKKHNNETGGPAVTVADIVKNRREVLRVSLGEFKGHHLLQLRVWAQGDDGLLPTKNGFGIRPDLIQPLRQALERAEQEARAMGWLPGEEDHNA